MSKASRRYYRTIILAILAMSSLVWMAVDQFDISPREMWELFFATAIGAGGIIVLAAVFVLVMAGFKKLSKRNRD